MAVLAAAAPLNRLADRRLPRARRLMETLLDQPGWTVDELEELVRRGEFGTIIDRTGVTKAAPTPDDWYALILQTIVDAAAAAALPAAVAVVAETHPQAVLWASRYAGAAIRSVTDATRAAVRTLIADAIAFGGPPRVIARDLAAVVGLDARSAQAVVNYRREVERALSSARSAAALRGRWTLAPGRLPPGAGKSLEARADAMAGAYRVRLLRRRAENIARTELQTAVARGQDIAWHETLDRDGELRGRARRVWISALDARTCARCRALHGQVVGFDEQFEGPLSTRVDAEVGPVGQLPPLHPGSCRCTTGLRFVDA